MTPLVRRAVDAFAAALVDANERWLQREHAALVVDALFPNRDFERSLSRGLVVEGVLAEDSLLREGTTRHDVVYVAYERLADHLVAKALLDGDEAELMTMRLKLEAVGKKFDAYASGVADTLEAILMMNGASQEKARTFIDERLRHRALDK